MANNPTIEQALPQSPEAERSVLGAILLDNHMLDVALDKLKAEDFFQDNHKRIFTQMIELRDKLERYRSGHFSELAAANQRIGSSGRGGVSCLS